MSDLTGAQFLRRAGGGGPALVAGGSVLGLAPGSVLTNIAANAIVPAPNLAEVLTAAQATKALTPFLG